MGKGESQAPKNPFPTLLTTPLHTVSQGYKSKNYLVTNFQLYRKIMSHDYLFRVFSLNEDVSCLEFSIQMQV